MLKSCKLVAVLCLGLFLTNCGSDAENSAQTKSNHVQGELTEAEFRAMAASLEAKLPNLAAAGSKFSAVHGNEQCAPTNGGPGPITPEQISGTLQVAHSFALLAKDVLQVLFEIRHEVKPENTQTLKHLIDFAMPLIQDLAKAGVEKLNCEGVLPFGGRIAQVFIDNLPHLASSMFDLIIATYHNLQEWQINLIMSILDKLIANLEYLTS